MNWTPFEDWLSLTSLWAMAIILFAAMCAAAAVGLFLRPRRGKPSDDKAETDGQEGYIVSAVLGLLALLMGFTFSLAVDRFETRRHLVLEEANAIGTAYLRVQLLGEPHRTRLSVLLIRYTDIRLALSRAKPGGAKALLAADNVLLTDIWAATSAAFDSIRGIDFSSTFVDSMNALINLDASRKTARAARVPPEVFAVLIIYLVTTAGVLGYVLKGRRGQLSAGFLLALLTLSLMLVVDIDRPTTGAIVEDQRPMEVLRQSLAATPRAAYDKWLTASR